MPNTILKTKSLLCINLYWVYINFAAILGSPSQTTTHQFPNAYLIRFLAQDTGLQLLILGRLPQLKIRNSSEDVNPLLKVLLLRVVSLMQD